jgi:hypothetical protein
MIMDAGKEEDLPRGVLGKRLPDWLRPSTITVADWKRMRPDLAVLPDIDSPTCMSDKELWVLELGYCSDTNHATKFITKHAQHVELVNGLRSAGYLVHYEVITVGTTGTIPTSFLTSMTTLGLQRSCALKLADTVHSHTITSFQSILQCRRFMEAHPGSIPGD